MGFQSLSGVLAPPAVQPASASTALACANGSPSRDAGGTSNPALRWRREAFINFWLAKIITRGQKLRLRLQSWKLPLVLLIKYQLLGSEYSHSTLTPFSHCVTALTRAQDAWGCAARL